MIDLSLPRITPLYDPAAVLSKLFFNSARTIDQCDSFRISVGYEWGEYPGVYRVLV